MTSRREAIVKFPWTAATGHLVRVSFFALMASLAACATPPTDPAARADFDATNDPLEPMNRTIFDFNQFADRILFRPLAVGYRWAVPEVGRNALRHFLDNLGEPVIFANDMMQGEFKMAHDTAARFFFNSSFGLGGLIDFASMDGLPRQSGDFGQTLYVWGVSDGPYLVLPIFGPSNPRDGVGLATDSYMDPWGYAVGATGIVSVFSVSEFTARGIDERSRNIEILDDLERNAIDFYAEMRSLSRQHRASVLRHGRPAPMPNLDSLIDPATLESAATAH
jgi:phospholipid-binding lipoprotein MlaA